MNKKTEQLILVSSKIYGKKKLTPIQFEVLAYIAFILQESDRELKTITGSIFKVKKGETLISIAAIHNGVGVSRVSISSALDTLNSHGFLKIKKLKNPRDGMILKLTKNSPIQRIPAPELVG